MSDAYQLNHLLDRKAMRDQDRFRASIGAGRKQLERAPAAGWGLGRCLRPCLDAAVIWTEGRCTVARGARFGMS